jgi:hypothetical protein
VLQDRSSPQVELNGIPVKTGLTIPKTVVREVQSETNNTMLNESVELQASSSKTISTSAYASKRRVTLDLDSLLEESANGSLVNQCKAEIVKETGEVLQESVFHLSEESVDVAGQTSDWMRFVDDIHVPGPLLSRVGSEFDFQDSSQVKLAPNPPVFVARSEGRKTDDKHGLKSDTFSAIHQAMDRLKMQQPKLSLKKFNQE